MKQPADPAAVIRAVQGDRIRLRPVERRAAVMHLTRQGWSARQIAEHLHICRRTVHRARCRARELTPA